MPKIYMAGPISGLTYLQSELWRDQYKDLMGPEYICASPLRFKQHLKSFGVIEQSYEVGPLSTDRGIMTRDHWDCMTADLIVCNLIGVQRVSIGTVMEIAWAFAYRKPLVAIIDAQNVHDHPMVREAIGFTVRSVEEAASISRAILSE